MKSKVYFTDMHTREFGDGLPKKLKTLILAAGIRDIDFDGKFVAIKMHFGELGNMSFLRPNWARAVVDVVKGLGGKPFLTDCNTMYPGSRKNALEHLYCAWENGFTPITVGCPILIGDGLKGTDDVSVEVKGGEYIKKAMIGRAIMDADIFISLTHFKGHEEAGFGGTIKNIGMGCGSRAGKADQHCNGKPVVREDKCRGCRRCQKECANNGLVYNEETRKMGIDLNNCVGCGRCLGACHCENDVPILPNIGMFASFDPLALDQACVDAALAAKPMPGSQLYENIHKEGFVDHHDHFKNSTPESEWRAQLDHAAKIGLGNREYEIVKL